MILVVAEQKDGKLTRASWETVAAAQQLSGGTMPITIAVAGQGVSGDRSIHNRHEAGTPSRQLAAYAGIPRGWVVGGEVGP